MRRLFTATLVATVILGSITAASALEPRQAAEQFFATLDSAGPDVAFDQLFKDAPIIEVQPGAVAVLKQQTMSALALYGSPIGVELVSEKQLGDSVVHLNYFQKFEMSPLAWSITFYRATDDWVPVGAAFNDKMQFRGE